MTFRFLSNFIDERREKNFNDIRSKFSKYEDIDGVDIADVPLGYGCYILQSFTFNFPYPWGVSRVFYIGTSKTLPKRVGQHKDFTIQARENRRKGNKIYYPRYEYGAAYGCEVSYAKDESILEGELLERFCSRYGAIPIANTQHTGFWGRFSENEDE